MMWVMVAGVGFLVMHAVFFALVYWRLGKLAKDLQNKSK